MTGLSQDLRLAARRVLKERGFVAATVATLALCLAANTAIFSVVNAVLLRPLPYDEPERLVTVFNAYPGVGATRVANSVPDYFERRQDTDIFSDLALYTWTGVTIGGQGRGDAERVLGMTVTPSFFRTLRAQPFRGAFFRDMDVDVGQHRQVVLSHTLWQRTFSGRNDVVGTDLRINGEPYTIIGVTHGSFAFDPEVQLWIPAAFSPDDRADSRRHSNNWLMVGRLARDVTLARAQRHLNDLNARNLERFPEQKQILINAGFHTTVSLLGEDIVREARPVILLLWGGVLVVLVIGCVNVASLASIRATTRSREMATRLALGATARRLIQQALAESLLLSAVGGVTGVVLAAWALRAIEALGIETLPRQTEIALDGQVMGYTFVLVTLVGVVVGLWPALSLRLANLAQIVREEGRAGTPSRRARTVRRLLVTSQVALALVLLMGAGLLLASFQRVLAVDLGFRADQVLTGDIDLPASRYVRPREFRESTDRMLMALRRLPGVVAAGLTTSIPFGNEYTDSVIVAEGYQMAPGESLISPSQVSVSDGYFETIGATLVSGRFIDARDTFAAPRVVVVDEQLARRFWPHVDPIGRRMYFPSSIETVLTPPAENERLTVVGVVKTMRLKGIVSDGESGRLGTYFRPYRQFPERDVTFVLKTRRDPEAEIAAVRAVIARIDPELAFYDVRPMNVLVDRALVDRRTPMLLAVGFAAVALVLSAIGIYGVLAYDVRQRQREIAIRMAIGASRAAIVRMVLTQGAVVVAGGVALGVAGAFTLGRAVESHLYGVSIMDPVVLSLVATVLLAVISLACVVPARRAASTHPTSTLANQ